MPDDPASVEPGDHPHLSPLGPCTARPWSHLRQPKSYFAVLAVIVVGDRTRALAHGWGGSKDQHPLAAGHRQRFHEPLPVVAVESSPLRWVEAPLAVPEFERELDHQALVVRPGLG